MRNAQYKSDIDSKVLHAAMPMIAIWDDHEVANDAYKNGAENHQDNEGDWEVCKAAAL
jgi:alkaline phosphatase D